MSDYFEQNTWPWLTKPLDKGFAICCKSVVNIHPLTEPSVSHPHCSCCGDIDDSEQHCRVPWAENWPEAAEYKDLLLICVDCFTAMTEWDEKLVGIGHRVQLGRDKRRNDAVARAEVYRGIMTELLNRSNHAAARELTARGMRTPNGALWSGPSVHRIRKLLNLNSKAKLQSA